MIIDFHTHAFPDKLAAGALETLTENTRRFAAIYGESRPHHDGTLAGLAASAKPVSYTHLTLPTIRLV